MTRDEPREIRNGLLYLVPVVLQTLLPFATLPIFTRILAPEDYGVLALAMVYSSLAVALCGVGLTTAYERNFFQHNTPEGRAALFYSVLAFVAVTLSAVGVATWLARDWLSIWAIRSPGQGALLFLTYCATAVQSLKGYCLLYFKNQNDAASYVQYTVDESILWVVFTLVLVAVAQIGVVGIPLGQLAGSLIVMSVLLMRMLQRLRPRLSLELLADSLRLGFPLVPKYLLSTVSGQLDKYLIALIGSPAGVGVYAIGQKFSYTVFSYMSALSNVSTPQVYQRMFAMGEAGGTEVGRYLTPFAYASVAGAFGLCLFSEELVMLLTPAPYHGAVYVINILAIYYAAMFFGKQPQLIFARKPHIQSMLAAFGVVMSAVITLWSVSRWGAIGAAVGTTMSGVLSALLGLAVAQRHYRIKYEYGKLWLVFGSLLAASVVVVLLRKAGAPYPLRLIAKGMLGISFLILGTRLGVLNSASVRMVSAIIRRRAGRVGYKDAVG